MLDKPIKKLTAAELVDLIEQEQKMVDDYEQQRQEGAASLLKVVHSIARQSQSSATVRSTEKLDAPITIPMTTLQSSEQATPGSEVEQELHVLVEELSELVGELCQQVSQFSKQDHADEPANTIAFRNLVNEQHAILEQLETISELLHDPSHNNRKIA